MDKPLDSAKLPKKDGARESLHEELKEGEQSLTKKMKEEKDAFIKQFQKH